MIRKTKTSGVENTRVYGLINVQSDLGVFSGTHDNDDEQRKTIKRIQLKVYNV